MANFPKGFKSSIAEGMRSQKANDEDVVPVLESFRKEVEPYASLAEPTPAQECLPMSRRLTLDENVALNQQTLYRIEGILRVEQRLADSLVEALGDSGEDQSGAGSNDKLYRCAVREMLSKSVSRGTPNNHKLTIWSRSTRRGLERARMLGPVPESDQAVALLEAFFEVCPDPNPAEYLFFARKFRCSEEQVIHWCESLTAFASLSYIY